MISLIGSRSNCNLSQELGSHCLITHQELLLIELICVKSDSFSVYSNCFSYQNISVYGNDNLMVNWKHSMMFKVKSCSLHFGASLNKSTFPYAEGGTASPTSVQYC